MSGTSPPFSAITKHPTNMQVTAPKGGEKQVQHKASPVFQEAADMKNNSSRKEMCFQHYAERGDIGTGT